jgi:uncharacterized protein (TIGR02444 family)
MIPRSPFWDFSLRLYARAGVPDACLALQARHGVDVNLLFCCLWLGLEGERLGRRDLARLAARVRDLHENVVKPLRLARTVLKRFVAAEDKRLRPAFATLRNAVKKSELDAEHLERGLAAGRHAGHALASARECERDWLSRSDRGAPHSSGRGRPCRDRCCAAAIRCGEARSRR